MTALEKIIGIHERVTIFLYFQFYKYATLAKTEIVYQKNVRAKVAMDFT